MVGISFLRTWDIIKTHATAHVLVYLTTKSGPMVIVMMEMMMMMMTMTMIMMIMMMMLWQG